MSLSILRKKGNFLLSISLLLLAACSSSEWYKVSRLSPEEDYLKTGIPGKADHILKREGYALGYSQEHKQARWVIYRTTEERLNAKKAIRASRFFPDPDIKNGPLSGDYARSGYDRGHLAPAADMTFSKQAMKECFYMTNMSPQLPGFNRGVWKRLEEQVRCFAKEEKDIYVVICPVFPEKKGNFIGKSRVTVPVSFCKVVFDLTPPQKMIGFIIPNLDSSEELQRFTCSVDAVERVTGLDFFPELPDALEAKLESSCCVSDWNWLGKRRDQR